VSDYELGKKRRRITRPRRKRKNDVENYAEQMLEFRQWCIDNDINFRESVMRAMRLFRLAHAKHNNND
jgi:hypothetical protein